jgi:hypothetical protein
MGTVQWIVAVLVVLGAVSVVVGHPFHGGIVGGVVAVAIGIFVLLELFGVLGHLAGWRTSQQLRLATYFRMLLAGEDGSE